MTTKHLALKLIDYRTTASLILPGRLLDAVGSDGVKEALNRRWIEPDTDSGLLRLSAHQSVIEEIQRAAEEKCSCCKCDPCKCCDKCHKYPCECTTCEDRRRQFVDQHLQRRLHEYAVPPAPGSGQKERTTPPPGAQGFAVGQDVVVAPPGGKTYSAKVSERLRDGTYRLSFGSDRPPDGKDVYRDTELEPIAKK